jgi:cyclopropane fatty-acyl-phospholipid synthase-like methyltransferase
MDKLADSRIRAMSREAARSLEPGAPHYAAYVGPPQQYDFMGATQFRLLTALGLREHHKVLDFGCGSLRAGRLLICYLLSGRYFGLEPNRWLIEDGIEREIGHSLVELKRPTFRYDRDFSAAHFGTSFDYILAQSIFSHAGRDIISESLASLRACLIEDGLVLATFVLPHQLENAVEFDGRGWIYPNCVAYKPETVLKMIEAAGLAGRALPWFHPRQTWFAMAHSRDQLPSSSDDAHLSGAVLRAQDFRP